MSLLGFKDRFVPLIEDGTKQQTIRGERPDIKLNGRLDLYARPRQPGMRLIFRVPCVRIDPIEIRFIRPVENPLIFDIWINGDRLTRSEKNLFAYHDGFRHADDMAQFWLTFRDPVFSGFVYYWRFEDRSMRKW